METLTTRRLNRATLDRQLLLTRAGLGPVAAVERLLAMQAQEPRHPFTGLWSRIDGFRRDDLLSALADGTIVRATLMRATLHLMSAADYAAFRMALAPGLALALGRAEMFDGIDMERLLPVATALLKDRPRDFNELRALLAAEFPDANDRALGYAVRTQLPLVMVPTGDPWGFPASAAFTLPAELSAEPRLEELLRRYLAAYGPASYQDAQVFLGLKGLKAVMGAMDLATYKDERGRILYDLPEASLPEEDVPAPARFLPEFDSLVLAHDDRRRIIADAFRPQVITKNLRVKAVFMWDGFARGLWQWDLKRGTATVRMTPFEPLPPAAIDELTAEAQDLARFLAPDASSYDVVI
ncbi:AlkZ family DNA glycosylase [Streptosporangiaceae bacterium NEAU-GS5]|nr:AlkZ family DNA glycosylase [Streptosporangiaceae bacterium NEAU-GS5]